MSFVGWQSPWCTSESFDDVNVHRPTPDG